jgi:RNA polymerase sigma factor (sigma-70 family)
MARSPNSGLLQYICHLVRPQQEDESSDDRQLLQRFVTQRDERAFAVLVRRHGPLVLGTCRQVLRQDHDAEDAFQATFLVLARKAASIHNQGALAAWLHRVALNIASTAKSSAAHRRAHERRAVNMSSRSCPGDDDEVVLRDLQPLLHEEVDRLPTKYRVPVVLCYLGGKTNEEAASELGWPLGTVKGRLTRARDVLRARLARRGLALSGGIATTLLLLSQNVAQATTVPATLADATVKASLLFAAGQTPATVSASALLLARGVLQTTVVSTKLRLLALALVVSLVTGLGVLLATNRQQQPIVPQQQELAPPIMGERIVFIGDSSTDGNTYLLLLRQALEQAGRRPVPGCINSGVSTDTMRGIRQRLERDVFAHQPTLVAISSGAHDAINKVPATKYEADLRAIAEQIQKKGIPLMFLTTGLLTGEFAGEERRLAEYNSILRKVASEHGGRVAEVNRRMLEARAAGKVVVERDNIHPNFEGQRLIARAVLDALGHADVPVPKELAVGLMPGILPEWRIRIAPGGQALNERLVLRLVSESKRWSAYTLPEKGPAASWWLEHERKRGFALSLNKLLGVAKGYQAAAHIQSDRSKQAFLFTGGHLERVWLNGHLVYWSRGWTGWHPGKERVPVRLRAGRNDLVIECGSDFFLSVSEESEMPQERPSSIQQGEARP